MKTIRISEFNAKIVLILFVTFILVILYPFNSSAQADLELPHDGKFKNHNVEITLLESRAIPGSTPSALDATNAFHQADRMISFYNSIFNQLGIPTLKNITISLELSPEGFPPSGNANENNNIKMRLTKGGLDVTILAHEIGHLVTWHLLGSRPNINMSNREFVNQQHGISEGLASIFGSLFTSNPKTGAFSYFECAFSVDALVRYPDRVMTRQNRSEMILNSANFVANYPNVADSILKELNAPELQARTEYSSGFFKNSDPYFSFASFTAPLWRASQKFGAQEVLKPLVTFLSRSNDNPAGSYQEFTEKLLENVSDPKMKSFLETTFRNRGLNNSCKALFSN